MVVTRHLLGWVSSSAVRGFSTSGADSLQKVLVLGGSGYVGSRVVQSALNRGADVISVNRSGQPKAQGSWASQVKWVKADVFDTDAWKKELDGVTGVVSCIGAFGSDAFMERINGDANVLAADVAAKAGVKNYVYVSTVENNLPSFLLRGYFNGKRRAEAAVLEKFPSTGVVLRPSFIYGTRTVGNMKVPLGLVGRPLEVVFRLPPFPTLRNVLPGSKAVLAPPVAVEAVGAVAAAAALGNVRAGVLVVDDIANLARMV